MKPLSCYCSNASDLVTAEYLDVALQDLHIWVTHHFAAVCLLGEYGHPHVWFEDMPEFGAFYDRLSPAGRLDVAQGLLDRLKEAQKCPN